MDGRKRRLWPWTAISVALPLLYALSFGPACWLATRIEGSENAWNAAYRPLIVALLSCSDSLYDTGEQFLLLGAPEGTHFWRDSNDLRWVPFEFDDDVLRLSPMSQPSHGIMDWRDAP